jgi:hypothetical protein
MHGQKNTPDGLKGQDEVDFHVYSDEELRYLAEKKYQDYYNQGFDAALSGRTFPADETWSYYPEGLMGWDHGRTVAFRRAQNAA